MTKHFRRTIVATLFVLSLVGLVVVSAQQAGTGAQGQGASAGQPVGAPAPTASPSPRPVPPEQKAYNDAMAITDMSARITALDKIREDFPQAAILGQVDSALLSQLVNNFPERIEPITATFDRIIARIPDTATAEMRVNSISGPIGVVVGKKLLLDRSETMVKDSIAALDPVKYAETLKDADKRANRPERTQAQLDQAFGLLRARPLELLGRIYVAKGDSTKAEAAYKEAVTANPSFGTATTALVDIYTAKNDYASAETLLKNAVTAAISGPAGGSASPTPAAAALLAERPRQALADMYIKKGDDDSAASILNEILKTNATSTTALVPLARIEAKKGDNAKALDHFMTASLGGQLKTADEESMKALYAKAHNGSAAGMTEALDKAYHDKFPNPVKPEEYKPSAARTSKLVLLELFTGSGCPPCVASDLAAEAVMERYGDQVISIAYHEHIPQPDPMVAGNNNDRRMYYAVNGVPTFEIDGAMVANAQGSNPGGGGRTNTPSVYNNYTSSIDRALETPARAKLDVKATGEGDQISVTVNVTAVPADAKDLRLHIVLAEKELRFTGENGIRFHPMAVRATAGEKGAGLPITATGTTKFTFSLSQIKDEITKSLATEMEKRHKGEAPGSTPREYVAESRGPYTAINTSDLIVVAFIQEGAYTAPKPNPALAARPAAPAGVAGGAAGVAAQGIQGAAATPPPPAGPVAAADLGTANILNAAKTDVVFAPTSKTKGGGR